MLRSKISETEDLVRIKKLAKSEFASSLSKNLLKTISNLSMEVMSLNQVIIKGIIKYYKKKLFYNY